jgi:uncharacterized NAD-dependent epimerase/dehydratase family protein
MQISVSCRLIAGGRTARRHPPSPTLAEEISMIPVLNTPYLLFLGSAASLGDAKTAAGIAYWRRELCCGQLRLSGCKADTGLPDLSLETAKQLGARSLIIGVAPMGGQFESAWLDSIRRAARMGFDIVSGLHPKLASIPELAQIAHSCGGRLIDVRVPPPDIKVASGAKRSGRRLLTVGTDCAVGKKYTALALDRALRERGRSSTFRATGQTGIMIAGTGVPIDAVVSDFVAGAAEALSPANEAAHWDIVEGQGSLFHPSYAGVTLGLVHGTQPDALVLCHDLSRSTIEHLDGYPIPPLNVCIEHYVAAARLTNSRVRCIGISVNSSNLSDSDYAHRRATIEAETGLPCADPVRDGVEKLTAALENSFGDTCIL